MVSFFHNKIKKNHRNSLEVALEQASEYGTVAVRWDNPEELVHDVQEFLQKLIDEKNNKINHSQPERSKREERGEFICCVCGALNFWENQERDK